MNLLELRSETKSRLGNVTSMDLGDARYNLWVNLGYNDLCGSYQFPQVKAIATATAQINDRLISLPDDCFAIYSVRDDTNKRKLTKVSDIVLDNLDLSTDNTGYAQHYNRVGNMLEIYPRLSAATVIMVRYCKTFDSLTDDDDEPVISSRYDEAIIMLSVIKGLSALFEYKKAHAVMNEFVAFMRSRVFEGEIEDSDNDYCIEPIISKYQ